MNRPLALVLCCLLLAPAAARAADFVVGINATEEAQVNLEIKNLLNDAFGRLGMKARIVSLPLARSLRDASNGEVDGVAAHFKVEVAEFDNLVMVPQPMARITYGFFSNANIRPVRSWEDITGRTLGIVRGDLPPLIEALKRGIRVYELNHGDTGFRMLQAGRLDVMVYEKSYGELHVREAALDNILVSPLSLAGYTYFVLNDKHAALAPELARVFREMLRDGSYARHMGKYKTLIPEILPPQSGQ